MAGRFQGPSVRRAPTSAGEIWLRETHAAIWSLAFFSLFDMHWSRWSGWPPSTPMMHVPQIPSLHEVSTSMPLSART